MDQVGLSGGHLGLHPPDPRPSHPGAYLQSLPPLLRQRSQLVPLVTNFLAPLVDDSGGVVVQLAAKTEGIRETSCPAAMQSHVLAGIRRGFPPRQQSSSQGLHLPRPCFTIRPYALQLKLAPESPIASEQNREWFHEIYANAIQCELYLSRLWAWINFHISSSMTSLHAPAM